MKVLLTGITGNLGHELAADLLGRGVEIVPVVRPGKTQFAVDALKRFENVVEADLMNDGRIEFDVTADCIVHCAGITHFRDSGNANERMMYKMVGLAREKKIPLYFVSTAFVYRPPWDTTDFNNSYEKDKYRAEQVLGASSIPHGIFRPSVLTGNSHTGEIQNFSGYYLMVRAFLSAARKAIEHGRLLRFPKMTGESNMVPVDQAAESIGKAIQQNRLETLYVTNPAAPRSEWILEETLNFFNVRDSLKIMDISLQEFGSLNLTEEEAALYRFSAHFSPYWSMEHAFPASICTRNLINHDYLMKALTFFRDSKHFSHGQKTH